MLKRDDGDEDKELNGGGDFVSNSSDSESEQEDVGKKRTREELEQEEVEALQRDLGEDHREGKRVNRKNTVDKADDENGTRKEEPSAQSEEAYNLLKKEMEVKPINAKVKDEELILVKKSFRFAGETVNEEKFLPASHPDAIAYLSDQKKKNSSSSSSSNQSGTSTSAISSSKPSVASGLVGPRKKKSSLAAMSAAVTGKPTKINTLEKSKMDWNKFKDLNASEQERDEMEAQTKGGGSGLGSMKGYMERKSFLDRVEGRLEGQKKS